MTHGRTKAMENYSPVLHAMNARLSDGTCRGGERVSLFDHMAAAVPSNSCGQCDWSYVQRSARTISSPAEMDDMLGS